MNQLMIVGITPNTDSEIKRHLQKASSYQDQ
jgi:hypothetical protein